MNVYTIYKESNGEIICVYESEFNVDMAVIAPAYGGGYIEGAYDYNTHYIKDGQPTERPDLPVVVTNTTPIPNGVDQVVISGYPLDTLFYFNNEPPYIDNSPPALYTFDTPGKHHLRLSYFPYKDYEVTIEPT